jgi:hypothetical protein
VGAMAAIVGGMIGGWVQGRAWFHYEQRRSIIELRRHWRQIAFERANGDHQKSLRGADLQDADLRQINLAPNEDSQQNVDLSLST